MESPAIQKLRSTFNVSEAEYAHAAEIRRRFGGPTVHAAVPVRTAPAPRNEPYAPGDTSGPVYPAGGGAEWADVGHEGKRQSSPFDTAGAIARAQNHVQAYLDGDDTMAAHERLSAASKLLSDAAEALRPKTAATASHLAWPR